MLFSCFWFCLRFHLFSSSRGCGNGWKIALDHSTVSIAWFASVYRDTIFVDDREAIEGGLPVLDGHGPFFRDVPQGQVEQLDDGLVVR